MRQLPKVLSQIIVSGAALLYSALHFYNVALVPRINLRDRLKTEIVLNRYSVHAETDADVVSALRAYGPRDAHGKSRDAYTAWSLRWEWKRSPTGDVDPKTLELTLKMQMTIPQLYSSSKVVKQKWERYYAALINHEFQHALFALSSSEKLLQSFQYALSIGQLSVAAAHRLGDQALLQIRLADLGYDLKTDHGKSEGVRYTEN